MTITRTPQLATKPRGTTGSHLVAAVAFAGALTVGCEEKGGACGSVSVEIAGDHGHSLEIGADTVKTGKGGVYPIAGSADHKHVVKLRDQDMAQLGAGQKVTQVASSVEAHTHEIGIACKP